MTEEKSVVVRDAMLRAFQDLLADVAQKIGELPVSCEKCPVYNALADFAQRLKKAGLQEEAEIVRMVREHYHI